ncbi:hypothetical protein Ciccas_002039 [Cichlidogyrus casuarinus]|uniref:Uncharacterized protein n=1 Tax=Cichlidogyrus casuarinus TaxID=1844966 RepID=A0ABD2QIG1_9PLAT
MWIEIYDELFVDSEIVSPLVKISNQVNQLLSQDLLNLYKEKPLVKSLTTTVVEEFNLKKPKARTLLVQLPPEQKTFSHPIPKSNYEQPIEFSKLNKCHNQNILAGEKLKKLSDQLRPQCAAATEKQKTRVAEEEEPERKKHKSKKVEWSKKQSPAVQVQVNTSFLVRENQLYDKRERDLINEYLQLEMGCFNDFEYKEWTKKCEEMDQMEAKRRMKKLALEAELSHAKAIEAKEQVKEMNKKKAQSLLRQKQRIQADFEIRRKDEQEKVNKLVAKVIASHAKAAKAVNKVEKEKRRNAEEILKESRELQQKKQEKEQQLMKQRKELIAQIRAMEAAVYASANERTSTDLVSKPEHGLLSEMSLLELKERLLDLRNQQEVDRQEKRMRIVSEKADKQQKAREMMERISRHRAARTVAAAKTIFLKKNEEQELALEDDQELNRLRNLLKDKKKPNRNGLSS